MRANYWLLVLCCFCLCCAAQRDSSYPHSKSLFFSDNTIVYFLFVTYLLFVGLGSHWQSVSYKG